MQATVDIDIGGTFTDCFVTIGDRSVWHKEPTTHHNLSLGFLQAIRGAAQKAGLALEDLLRQTAVIRYSTTIGMNSLLERSGPRLGLITTAGFEDTIYIGKGSQWSHGIPVEEWRNTARVKKPEPLIPRHLTVGLRERIDCLGRVVVPLREEEVIEKVQYLVDQGCQGFVVSLLWSFLNPVHEQMVKRIIEEEYPDHYLGRMPVVLSSEVRPKLGEYPRTMTAVLTAYLQSALHEHLAALGEDLRDLGYRRPLLVVHNTGGMAKVSRTKAVDTYNAGPVAGLHGARHIASGTYGLKNVIVADMGGTSFDIGLIVDGNFRYVHFMPTIDRWWVDLSMVETQSIGAGGGSIAWFRRDLGVVEVGPRSAGSMPGPACYDQGGGEPTVTDADLLLGYLNPHNYLGGRKKLNPERARRAMERLAREVGAEPEELALRVRRIVDGHMGNEIFKETALRAGRDPREFVIFAYGGAGPTHACGFADYVGVKSIYVFPFASVFCAFGSSTMDIVHMYERSKHVALREAFSGRLLEDLEEFNRVVEQLREEALKDIRSEGLAPESVAFSLELEARYGTQLYFTRFSSPLLFLRGRDDVAALVAAFNKAYAETYDPIGAYPEGGVEIETFILKAIAALPKTRIPRPEFRGRPGEAYAGTRRVCWDEGGYLDTPIFDLTRMAPGEQIPGPAIIEAPDTTVVVPHAYSFALDEYGCGLINRAEE